MNPVKKAPPPPKVEASATWAPFTIDTLTVDQDHNVTTTPIRVQRRTGPSHPLVPELLGHVFEPGTLRELSWALWPHDGGAPSPVLLVGPKGAGKTSVVTQLAARANMPVYRINLNAGTTVKHLKGQRGAKDGSTVFYDGIVTKAMEEGAWLLLDEVSGATPHVALSLFPVLEPRGLVYLEEAEPPRYITRHPDFRVFMTDNVIGAAQEDNRFAYSGTNPDTNEALLDRIHSTINVGYLPHELEHQAVKMEAPNAIDLLVGLAIKAANQVRSSPSMPGFSTRMVIEWSRRMSAGQLLADGQTKRSANLVLDAAEHAFLSKMRSRTDADAVAEVIRRVAEVTLPKKA